MSTTMAIMMLPTMTTIIMSTVTTIAMSTTIMKATALPIVVGQPFGSAQGRSGHQTILRFRLRTSSS